MSTERRCDFDTRFGNTLRTLREAAGLSQQDVATRMPGWHQTPVSKVEAGQRPLWLREAVELARSLGTTVADLTEGDVLPAAERIRLIERATRERIAAEILEGRPATT